MITPAVAGRSPVRLAFMTTLVFVASFLVLALLMPPVILDTYDEGIILTGAMRVAAGAVPHRDFYTNFGPGQFYVLSGLFDLFGQTVLVERLYDLVVKAGIVCFVYVLASYLVRPPFAALATAFGLLWTGVAQFPNYPVWPTLLLLLASIWLAIPVFCGSRSALRLFTAGLCAGGAVLFRYDQGLLGLMILSAFLVLFSLIGPRPCARGARFASILAPFWGASCFILIILALIYIRYGIAADFVFQVINYPSLHYVAARGLPFPIPDRAHLLYMIIYMPPLVFISFSLFLIAQYHEWNSSKVQYSEVWISTLIASLAAILYFRGLARITVIQMMFSIIPSFVVLSCILDRVTSRRLVARGAVAVSAVAAVVFTLVPSLIEARNAKRMAVANLSDASKMTRAMIMKGDAAPPEARCNGPDELPRARCFSETIPQLETFRYIVSHSTYDQPIFVANGVNDKMVANDMALYFLAGRQPATKWAQFDPDLQNTVPIQAEMLGELQRNQPPLVILDTEWDDANEPNTSARHSGVTLLDDYIHKNYRTAADFTPYHILKRCLKPADCGF